MRRSADEIGATSISFRPKVFSDPASVVDWIFLWVGCYGRCYLIAPAEQLSSWCVRCHTNMTQRERDFVTWAHCLLAWGEHGHSEAIRTAHRSTTGSQPRTHDLGPQRQSHRHGHPRSDSPRTPNPACMAPNDDWGRVCAWSRLDRLLGICACEVSSKFLLKR